MSFVNLVSEEQAGASLKKTYQQLREYFGFLPNYFLAIGRLPR